MPRASSVEQLPEAIRAEIGRLRMAGRTLDDILSHLKQLAIDAPSRSALGRWSLKMDKLGEHMRNSRVVAEALASHVGDAPESQAARLNIELLHNALLQLHLNAAEADEGSIAEGGQVALRGDPQGLMMLAKAVESLTRASKTNTDFTAAVEKRATEKAKRAAAEAVEGVAKARGLSAETAAEIRASIFGVAA